MSDNELLEPENESKDDILRRLKILYLYKILYEQTDENHGITMPGIIKQLGELGISAARKSIYRDIKALMAFGVDIQADKGAASSYRILSRKFELPELTALADSVINSHFFSAKRAEALIEKLGSLCSREEAAQLKPGALLADNSAEYNEKILYNVDAVHRAIAQKKQLSFNYFEYVFDYSQKRPKKKSRGIHICSPIALAWNDGKYYLIAYYQKYKGISHFRVDKMDNAEVLLTNAEKLSKDFKLSEYMKSTFSMFSGELADITMRFENSLMNAVIDRFGKINPKHDGRDHFKFTVPVRLNSGGAPTAFFGWLFQFGDKAQIVAPESVREQYFEMLNAVLNNKDIDD